jgi:hypothetical protein
MEKTLWRQFERVVIEEIKSAQKRSFYYKFDPNYRMRPLKSRKRLEKLCVRNYDN